MGPPVLPFPSTCDCGEFLDATSSWHLWDSTSWKSARKMSLSVLERLPTRGRSSSPSKLCWPSSILKKHRGHSRSTKSNRARTTTRSSPVRRTTPILTIKDCPCRRQENPVRLCSNPDTTAPSRATSERGASPTAARLAILILPPPNRVHHLLLLEALR